MGHHGSAGHLIDAERPFDAQLAQLAPARHAVFALEELVGLGLSERAVYRRATAGRLHRVHRGVYSLVPPPLLTLHGRYRAATLACSGSRHLAALSHRSAADLHGLRICHRRTVEVIVPGRSTHRHPVIQTHRSVNLAPEDLTTVEGIVVTTPARTCLDLAAVVPRRAVERALDQGKILRTLDLGELLEQLRRNPAHPGAGRLRATLTGLRVGETLTASVLEEVLLAVCRLLDDVPAPECNAAVDPGDGGPLLRPDAVWRAQRVAVEVDGERFHLTRRAFQDDRLRDQRLTAAGWRVIRTTARQLRERPDELAAVLRTLLAT